MIGYTSALPNKKCLEVLSDNWRFLISPASEKSITKNNRYLLYKHKYAIDNGAYSWHVKNEPFNDDLFIKLLDKYAAGADWIVIPDKVGDFFETCRLFMIWYQKLLLYNRKLLFVAQDGIQQNNFATVHGMTSKGIGIFIGGTTEFKLKHSKKISEICNLYNEICHVGRVNSAKRLRLCFDWKVTSFDGSGMSRFTQTARVMDRELNQGRLF